MSGWQNNSEEVFVEKIEEYVDTNPELYKQRTIAALNDGRYSDALKEARLAIKFGNNEAQYRLLAVRVLFEMKDFALCMQELVFSGLWSMVLEEENYKELLMDEVDFIFYAYGICYKNLGRANENSDVIIVTPDGKGMCSDIQTAVNTASSEQEIIITSGTYYGDIIIKNKNVNIFGTSVGKLDSNIYPVLSGQILVENSEVEIYALSFNGANTVKDVVKIRGSKAVINQCVFSNNSNVTGIYLYMNSECLVEFCRFIYLNIGIVNEVHNNILSISQCYFEKNRAGVVATDETRVFNSIFVKNRDAGLYSVLSRCERISVNDTDFEENGCGIIIVDSKINIVSSKFYRNRYHIAFEDAGYFNVCNSSFIGSKGPAFVGKRNIEKCRKLKEYIGYMYFENCLLENNNSLARRDNGGMELLKHEKNLTIRNNGELSSYAEGIKSFLNKWM